MWQMMGRGGRDGEGFEFELIVFPRSLNLQFVEREMVEAVRRMLEGEECCRHIALELLTVDQEALAKYISEQQSARPETTPCCSSCQDKRMSED